MWGELPVCSTPSGNYNREREWDFCQDCIVSESTPVPIPQSGGCLQKQDMKGWAKLLWLPSNPLEGPQISECSLSGHCFLISAILCFSCYF